MEQFEALKLSVAAHTTAMNARGDTEIELLQDVEVRIREVALHGVREGAAQALASAQF